MFDQRTFAYTTGHAAHAPKIVLRAPREIPGKTPSELFTESLLEQASARQHRSPLEWAVSFAVHATLLAALLLVPLMFTQRLDLRQFRVSLLTAPGAPAAPPPPPPASASAPRPQKALPKSFYTAGRLVAPSQIPQAVAIIHEQALPPDLGGGVVGGVVGGVPGGQPGGVLGGIIGGVLGSNGAIAPPPPPHAVATASRKPIPVGGDVKQPRLLFEPALPYPPLARQTRTEGDVIVDAIIDEQGNVSGAHIVSGHPLLLAVALDSVSHRKYQPTYLNGVAVSIELEVAVHFQLHQ